MRVRAVAPPRGRAGAAGAAAGGGPLTHLRAVPQQGRVDASIAYVYVRITNVARCR